MYAELRGGTQKCPRKNEIAIYFTPPKSRRRHVPWRQGAPETPTIGKYCVFVKDKSPKKIKGKSPRCETNGNYHTYRSCLAENQYGTDLHSIRPRPAPEKPKTRLYWFSSQIEACGHTFSNKNLKVKKQRR